MEHITYSDAWERITKTLEPVTREYDWNAQYGGWEEGTWLPPVEDITSVDRYFKVCERMKRLLSLGQNVKIVFPERRGGKEE